MKQPQLVYVGIHGSVLALDRATGLQVWATHLKGSSFVVVHVDQDQVYAITYGEIFCLDAATGQGRWHNRLKGLGTGLASVATPDRLHQDLAALLARKRQEEEDAETASTAASV